MRIAPLLAAALAGIAAAPPSPVDALAGRYSWHFRNGLVDGTSFWSDDVVEVVPVDAEHAYIRFALNFYNGHVCSLAGVAEARGDALVYTEPADRPIEGQPRCTLTVRRAGAKLAWDDGGSCKSYCGARGSFLGGEMAWSSRRPITYLPRLKTSSAYRDALAEWRTGRSVNP